MKPIRECNTLQELFCDESRWTKYIFARNKFGKSTGIFSDDATCFCLYGGVKLIAYFDNHKADELFKKIHSYLNDTSIGSISNFNDSASTTFEMIKNLVAELNI